MKIFLLFSLIVVLIVIGISSGIINISKIENNKFPEGKLLLSRLENMGSYKLITFNVNYIVEDTINTDTSEVGKNNKKKKVLAIINGNIDACINLKRIEKDDINEGKDTAFVSLPMPVLCNTEINYSRSIIYNADFNSQILNQNFIDKYFPNTINNLKAEAIRMGMLDQAKINALQILHPVIKEILKKDVVLKFEED
ncbi:MAG: DUF4230 domain-containing protein [Ignavibacteriaceae bacterium]